MGGGGSRSSAGREERVCARAGARACAGQSGRGNQNEGERRGKRQRHRRCNKPRQHLQRLQKGIICAFGRFLSPKINCNHNDHSMWSMPEGVVPNCILCQRVWCQNLHDFIVMQILRIKHQMPALRVRFIQKCFMYTNPIQPSKCYIMRNQGIHWQVTIRQ